MMLLLLVLLYSRVAASLRLVPYPKSVELGTLTFPTPRSVRIGYSPSESSAHHVSRVGKTFAHDLDELEFDVELDVNSKKGIHSTSPLSIVLSLSTRTSEPCPSEGYTLDVDGDPSDTSHPLTMRIDGCDATGLFWGTRTALQLLQMSNISHMSIQDEPVSAWRELMIDNSRVPHTFTSHMNIIKQMSALKLNMYHIHISDDQGYSFPSKLYPQLQHNTSADKKLTFDQIASLVQQAEQYHVIIVPEIDVPGHAKALLANIPALGGQKKMNTSADITFTVLQGLFDEVMDMIPGPYWHLGADEFNGQGIVGFINRMNKHVQSRGRTMAVWEGFTPGLPGPQVDKSVMVMPFDVFHPNRKPIDYFAAGYKLINANWSPGYFCNGKGAYPYELAFWDPTLFGVPTDHTTPGTTGSATSRAVHSTWQRLPKDIWNADTNVWPNHSLYPYPYVPDPYPTQVLGGSMASWAQAEEVEQLGWFGKKCNATGLEAPRAAIFADKVWAGAASNHDDILTRVGCPLTLP